MFEIGNTLREARLRKGLGVLECEDQTKIRAKYLRALEDEEFDALPSGTYVRGFLKTYADFLGLDSQLVIDEHDSRFGGPDDSSGDSTPGKSRKRSRRRGGGRSEVQLLWLAIGGVMGVALLVWMGAGGGAADTQPLPQPAAVEADGEIAALAAADGDVQPAASEPGVAGEGPRQVIIVLTGRDGGSWLQVRGGSAEGREVFRGTLRAGEERRFGVQRGLWIRIGNTGGVGIEVDGEEQSVAGGVADVLITPNGLSQLAEYE